MWQSTYSAHRGVLSEVWGTTAVSEYKKHLIITRMGNAASYRERLWLQEYSSWEVDAIWLSLRGWLWLSVIDWWLIDRWRRGKGYIMSARPTSLLFQSSNFCGVCNYQGGNFSFSPTRIAASMSSRPEVYREEQKSGESIPPNTFRLLRSFTV